MLPDGMRRVWLFVKRDFLEACTYPAALGLELFGVLGSVLSFYFLSRAIGSSAHAYVAEYGGDYFSFALIGVLVANFFNVAITAYREVIRYSQVTGTIESLVLSGSDLLSLVICLPSFRFVWAVFSTVLYLCFGAALGNIDLRGANISSSIVVFVLLMVSFCSMGILAAAFTIVMKKTDPFTWVAGIVSTAVGGTIYPITALPCWLRGPAQCLPLTIGLDALRRAVLQGAPIGLISRQIAELAIWAVLLVCAAVCALRYCASYGRRYGILAHY